MVRIGGKGMTHERDRIQENANKYIVKNCPCLKSQISYKDKLWINGCSELGEVGSRMCCQDITDCVIKQIITICKWYKMSKEDMKRSKEFDDIIRGSKYGRDTLAIQILQLLDIEEVK